MSYRGWRERRQRRQWRRLLAGLPFEVRVFIIKVLRAER